MVPANNSRLDSVSEDDESGKTANMETAKTENVETAM
jgi:hypothetical protein